MARNIILTTIDDSSDILNMNYFVKKESTEEEFNSSVYCHSTMNSEAIVKYILSKYKIDEIIVFGNKANCDPGDELKDIELRKNAKFITASQNNLSTYSLYRYRLEQYLDMLDFSYSDLQEYLSLEDMEKLSDAINKYSRTIIADGKRPARVFSAVAESDELWSEVLNSIRALLNVNELSNAQIAAIKYLLYLRMSEKNKMEILEENENVAVSFIPVEQSQESQKKNLLNSLNIMWLRNEEVVNVYVGAHSGNLSTSSFFMSLLNVLTELGKINIKKIFSIHKNDYGFGYNISDDTDQYHYTHLLDGIITFVNTGKVDKIMDSINKIGHIDDLSRDIVYEMRNIDASISLCDIDKMVDGLESLKKMITQKRNSEEQVYSLFETVLKKGYGSLLEGDSIDIFDLIKWSYGRKLYQQTLTIIESKIPNDMFDRGLYYYCNSQTDKEKVTTQFAECYNLLKRHETYKMKHLEHYYIKFYGRAEAKTSAKDPKHQALNFAKFKTGQIATIGKEQVKDNNCTDGLIPAHTLSNNLQAIEDALFAYYYIGNVRNMTNHADTGEDHDIELFPDVTEDIQKMKIVTEAIEFFIQKYEIAIESLKENIPEDETASSIDGGPVNIQPNEVRSVARKLFEEKDKQNKQ